MEKENRTDCDSYHTRLISKSNPHIVNLEKKKKTERKSGQMFLCQLQTSQSRFFKMQEGPDSLLKKRKMIFVKRGDVLSSKLVRLKGESRLFQKKE